jgi:transposase
MPGKLLFLFSVGMCYGGGRVKRTLAAGNHFRRSCSRCWSLCSLPWQFLMVQAQPTIVELERDKLEEILRRLEAKQLAADDYETLEAVLGAYVYLVNALGDKETTLRRLRQLLFGAKTEKTAAVLAGLKDAESASASEAVAASGPPSPVPAAEAVGGAEDSAAANEKSHGRNGADAYRGAEQIEVPHELLKPGDPCPKCEEGTLYDTGRPGVVVRLVGQPPIGATVYHLQKLRCGLCGVVFTAEWPDGVGEKKYDATVGSMIALLKYGTGMPFHREEKLQANLGIPLPASTQWGIVRSGAENAEPVFEELIHEAAQGDLVQNDDTTARILQEMGERARQAAMAAESSGEETADGAAERRGLFTSGIVATRQGRRIALFFTGHQHAGENLKDVLARRAAELGVPIQMCDALSRNLPGELQTILANCLAHARRHFVEVVDRFPDECQHVLETLAVVYKNDAVARQRSLSPEERLLFHQAESGPVMEELHVWLVRQFDQRLVEPNSALGGAIQYLLRHWEKLTLFLRQAGAPLDNNLCERALKKAILHRKNALFYKTLRGAHVGDVFMSLIHTCELGGINAFDYLTELDRHAKEVAASPRDWMPWNYRETLQRMGDAQAPSEESR